MLTLVRGGGSGLSGGVGFVRGVSGGFWFVRGGGPPDTCPGGVGFVRGVSGGCPGGTPPRTSGGPPRTTPRTRVREAPPDTPRTSGPPPGQGIPRFLRPWLPKRPSIFSSTVSIFEAFCVARPCMLLGQIGADFHTSRDRFQLFAPLCSSRNPERVIRYEPLLYSKITIRVLRTATTVPIRTSPMAAKS